MEIKLTVQLYLAQPDVIFLWFVSLQFAKYSSNIKYIISKYLVGLTFSWNMDPYEFLKMRLSPERYYELGDT